MSVSHIKLSIWGLDVGVLEFNENSGVSTFQYFPEFVSSGIELSPLHVPLSNKIYSFPELSSREGYQDTFCGLPGFIADSLPEKFGNRLLSKWLADQGLSFNDMSPLDRLCYLGSRGMGALEYTPDYQLAKATQETIDISELVSVAQKVLSEQEQNKLDANQASMSNLVSVGTSAGGAKAKAVIAWNEQTQTIMSGQGELKAGYTHWLLKFDEIDNEEHASSKQIGRIEYAYHLMAVDAGIDMMPCRLLVDGDLAHFMTQRFDRTIPDNSKTPSEKIHVVSFCGMDHADRNPPGEYGYESLFRAMRSLGMGQSELDQMYRRLVFNLMARNQDDHTKNHAFMLLGDGSWVLTPAFDLCFSYKEGNPFIAQHQMSCNGKRDNFELKDLLASAKSADIKSPLRIINEVKGVLSYWSQYARDCGIDDQYAAAIGHAFRRF